MDGKKLIIVLGLIVSLILAYQLGGYDKTSFQKQVTNMRQYHYMFSIKGKCFDDYPIKSGGKCFDTLKHSNSYLND